MVEISEIVDLLPFLSIAFAAGVIYLKIQNMNADLKELKNHFGEIKEGKSIHDQLIKSQRAAFSAYIEAFTSLIAAIQKATPSISNDLVDLQSKLAADSINKTLQAIEGGTGNPVSAEEAQMLQSYVEKAQNNESFTPDEAQDFYSLSQRVSEDRSDDEGAWGILLLAGIILALYYLNKKSKENNWSSVQPDQA